MIKTAIKLFIITMSGILISCSPDMWGTGKFETDASWSADNIKLQCAGDTTSKNCGGQIGILYFKLKSLIGDTMSGRCTAWLSSSNTVTANSHCFTDKEYGLNDIDINNAFFRGPEGTKTGSSPLKITKVIKSYRGSNNENFGVDYAVFKLSSEVSEVKPLEYDRSELVNGEKLTSVVVNAGNGPVNEFVLDSHSDCTVSFENVLFLIGAYTGQQDSFVGFKNCPSIEGNSGAPMVSANGKVKAILWGYHRVDDISGVDLKYYADSRFVRALIDTNDDYYYGFSGKVTLATPSVCIPEQGSVGYVNWTRCNSSSMTDLNSDFSPELFNLLIKSKLKESSTYLGYDNLSNEEIEKLEFDYSDFTTTSSYWNRSVLVPIKTHSLPRGKAESGPFGGSSYYISLSMKSNFEIEVKITSK